MRPFPVIIVNQTREIPQPYIINQKEEDYKIILNANSQAITCPYCHQNISTVIDEKCNCCSFICYMIMMIIFPIFVFYTICVNNEECICELGCDMTDNCCCYPTC